MSPSIAARPDLFAPGHLGELTRIVSADLVDAALEATRTVERRRRLLPSRVVVYLVLAGVLFAESGYRQVYARLAAGIGARGLAPGSSALSQAIRRIGVAPLRELFGLLAGPAAGGVRWRGLVVCAIDGTSLYTADTASNAAVFGRQAGRPGAASGYPMLRLLTVVACGSRTVIDAVFGCYRTGETTYAARLLGCLRPGMVLLADRNFDAAGLIGQIAATGAGLLIRCRDNRLLTPVQYLPDGTWIALVGGLRVRVIDAAITVDLGDGGPQRRGRYRLITTLTDHHHYPAVEVVELYHQRWEIETSYLELKSSILAGRVLRARTPAGVTQEIYAVLIVYQALRTALADAALTTADVTADRLSFTIALTTARDQIHCATDTLIGNVTDLTGRIGHAVLASPLPARRLRSCPRVVKRAISKHRATGDIDRTNHTIAITTEIRPPGLTQPTHA